jgi:hypothetical protein
VVAWASLSIVAQTLVSAAPRLVSALGPQRLRPVRPRFSPPNNLNISADFQNRYALLKKGLQFTEMITSAAEGQAA